MWYSVIRELEKRESPAMKKRSIIIIAVVIVIIAALISIPYILNSPIGRRTILSKFGQKINYSLESGKTHFSWLGPQRAENLTAVSSSGIQYNFPELSLDMPLWGLWKKISSIGITHIFNPTVIMPQVDKKPDKEVQSIDSVISTHKKCSQTNCCRIFGEIHVTDGKIYLSQFENSIDIPKLQYICNPDGITLHADAKFPNGASISHIDIAYHTHAQNVQLQGRDIPSDLFGAYLGPWNGISIQEILGPTLNMNASAELIDGSGPIFLNLHSPNASIVQSGKLFPDRYILDQPLTISMQISERLLDSIFRHPILHIDPIESPITMTIEPQEILFPISPSTEIRNGSIHIGRISCTNRDLLFQLATQVLRIDDPKIDIWFSDIPVDYADGILRVSRSEILLQNKYPLAIWGKIDYFQKKVNLTLAITERTLRKVFGIKSLPPDFVITCPIKGSFDDIQLDIGKLAKRLSILIAKEKAKKQIWKEGANFFEEPTIIPPPIQSIPWDNK